jgi:hypothetical protein
MLIIDHFGSALGTIVSEGGVEWLLQFKAPIAHNVLMVDKLPEGGFSERGRDIG